MPEALLVLRQAGMSLELETLLQPLTADAPCGADLEDSQLLASFDAYRLFGSDVRLPAKTDWREIFDRAQEALAQSKDLRLLAHLGAAVLHSKGLDEFCETLVVADAWLREYWNDVYPRVDDDAMLRKNALSCLADRMAVVDGVRRAPIVAHRQLGSYSLRHVELATGQLQPGENETEVPTQQQVDAALEDTAVEVLQARRASIQSGLVALRNITDSMQTHSGVQSTPDFAALMVPLARIDGLLAEHLLHRSGTSEPQGDADGAPSPHGSPASIRDIQSRQDAIRAIETIAAYFRKNEPSSPVPLLLDRAKRLVSKSFLEVLEDIVPDSLAQARAIGGIKADET